MSQDPFYVFRSEVESSLQQLAQLHSSYNRILSINPLSEEASYTLSELKATLLGLEGDAQELGRSVEVLRTQEAVRTRLGIGVEEVRRREEFVRRVRGEIKSIKQQLSMSAHSSPELSRSRTPSPVATRTAPSYKPFENAAAMEEGKDTEDEESGWEREHQSLLVEQQDRTLTDISGTVGLLRSQARLMGQEVHEQNAMLDELGNAVDETGSRLERAQRKMERFVQQNKNSKSSWFILILIGVLFILLVLIAFS